MSKPIFVTRTFLPPIDEFNSITESLWQSAHITNRGKLVVDLEQRMQDFLRSRERPLLLCNGTLALQVAIKALDLKGEIITTPFSYVATTSAIVWENCTPVFVDINPDHCTIDESKIEAAVTKNTTAILATHVYGNPCEVEKINEIAQRHNLKVIYDAAHCFAVDYNGRSVFDYGDISICSLHATKLFHTGEGGAIFCHDKTLGDRIFSSHTLGHDGPEKFAGLGINGKMSEINAAMGLSVLPYMPEIIKCRKDVIKSYEAGLDFSHITKLKIREGTTWNYAYYPVFFKDQTTRDEVYQQLHQVNVFPRKYFFPSLNLLPYVKNVEMPVAE